MRAYSLYRGHLKSHNRNIHCKVARGAEFTRVDLHLRGRRPSLRYSGYLQTFGRHIEVDRDYVPIFTSVIVVGITGVRNLRCRDRG